jgi:poly(A) polymerase
MRRFYPEAIKDQVFNLLSEIASDTKTNAYVVGGFVRDYLLGIKNDDIDVVVEGSGIEFAKVFANKVNGKLSYYENYGTAMVRFGDQEVEFVGARKEMYERGSRKPIVEEGTLYDDISRRDFTINAMAFSLNENNYGELIDYFNGFEDLGNKIIKTPLEPSITFSDDPLRMFRAVRFLTKLPGFTLDPVTKEGIVSNVERTNILTRERITGELEKMLSYPKPLGGLQMLEELGLWDIAFIDCPYNELNVQAANKVGKVNLRWFLIVEGSAVTKREFQQFTNKMRLPNELSNYFIRVYQTYKNFIGLKYPSISLVRHCLNMSGEEAYDALFAIYQFSRLSGVFDEADAFDWLSYAQAILNENSRFIDFKLPANGREISEWSGIPEGSELGRLIDEIKEEILDGKLNDSRESIYAFIKHKKLKNEYTEYGII